MPDDASFIRPDPLKSLPLSDKSTVSDTITGGKNANQCKRVYFPAEKDDGYRVLVDRLWPRGIKKAALVYDEWNKAITPSTELRKAFHSELIDFNHFAQQYRAELAQQHQEGKRLADIARHQPLTLLYAAKDTRQNHAIVLAEWLREL